MSYPIILLKIFFRSDPFTADPELCSKTAFSIMSFIKKFSRLEKFIEDIESIETVKSYLNLRPELIDVSVEPKLVIDGVAHPTGVKKT